MAIPKYDYQSFLSLYVSNRFEEFSTFVRQSPTLKMLSNATMDKLTASITCRFMNTNEFVYRVGDRVDGVFIVYKGKAYRKVIV
jgi:hypothetical protein